MVTYWGSSRFFARTSNGKYQLDVEEIRAAFLLSDRTAERIRDFRLDRIAKIRAEDTPEPLDQGAKIVLHVVPLSAFSSISQIDLQSVAVLSLELQLIPLGLVTGWDGRFNLEGYVRYSGLRDDQRASAYLQIFRNGALETVDTSLASHSAAGGHLRGADLERDVIEKLGYYVSSLKRLGVDVPLAVMISLLGVKGYTIRPQESTFMPLHGLGRFDRDVVLVSEVLLGSLDTDIGGLMKQPFDMMWNAAGWACSIKG
jgi:hypothetical protein